MERDFESQLDSDTFEGFIDNLKDWAGEHDSDAVDAVALEVWSELHEDEPLFDVDTEIDIDAHGILHNRGRFASAENIEELTAENLSDQTIEASLQALIDEIPTRYETILALSRLRKTALGLQGETVKVRTPESPEPRLEDRLSIIGRITGELNSIRGPHGRLGEAGRERGIFAPIPPSELIDVTIEGEKKVAQTGKKRDAKGRFVKSQ